MINTLQTAAIDDVNVLESNRSGISWGPIIGGAVVAAATSLILLALGSGIGLSAMSPWSNDSESLTGFTVKVAIWLIIVQWVASGLGGYIAGRLRKKWVSLHGDEVFFRDTAHGFITWALSTVLVAGLLASAAASVIGGTTQAVAIASPGPSASRTADPLSYYVDSLFRSDRVGTTSFDVEMRNETGRILARDLKRGEIPDADRAYLSRLVSGRTGLSQAEARKRVDDTITEAKADADAARKAGAAFSLFTCFSMLIGAFIASIAGVLGGRHRDLY